MAETFTVKLDGNQVGKYHDKMQANIKARQVLRANPGKLVFIVHDSIYTGPKIVTGTH